MCRLESNSILARNENIIKNPNDWSTTTTNVSKATYSAAGRYLQVEYHGWPLGSNSIQPEQTTILNRVFQELEIHDTDCSIQEQLFVFDYVKIYHLQYII